MTDIQSPTFEPDTQAKRDDRIRRVIAHLQAGTTDSYDVTAQLSPRDYTDPGIAEAEREFIFGRVPSIVAHGSEIAEPGQFITVQMPRNKVIVVRQRDGGVKVFVNACRHRGATIASEPSGKCRLFSCPYHRWSYDTDGSLRTITREDTVGDLDHEQLSLVELPAEERHGFVWMVDKAGAAIDVARWLGPEMDAALESYGIGQYISYRSGSFTEAVNWKIMQDAFLDGYHIQYAHPNTAGKYIHTNISVLEDYGRHCRWIKPRKSIDRWIDQDPAGRSLDKHLIETQWLGPNSTLLRQPDHVELLTFRPHHEQPGLSVMEMRVIVPLVEDTELDPERWNILWEKNWDILLRVLHAEDFPILRGVQQAMESADAGPMVLGKNEIANHIFRRETVRLLQEGAAGA
jgi:phenylpropionate dioxygenase-like ring-hydroxylating dioxygenase large terminal subunit